LWHADPQAAERLIRRAVQEVHRLEEILSNYDPDSALSKLNRGAGEGGLRVPPELFEILACAREFSEKTGGIFDVTVGPLIELWRHAAEENRRPSERLLSRAVSAVGYRKLRLEQPDWADLTEAGMRIDLGGIGKGYAVDRARDILHGAGFRDFLIQFGGDMYAAGTRGERPWRLGIQDPRGAPGQIFAAIDLSDATLSTSGDYERSFIKGGRRYHHILDPATGVPAAGCRSVTIVTGSATIADGLSTGVFILGPEAGMALIERLPEVEGVIVSAANAVFVSSGLQQRLQVLAQPTDAP
jgi:thiamine biosynthesis lipoprotein